jgi:predicted AAA+ superfamily ATPase
MKNKSAKKFNVAGPCTPNKRYILPVLPRLPIADEMIDNEYYFILHAPRQSGKTTFIRSLTDKINNDGQRYALNCSLATLRSINDEEKILTRIVSQINESIFFQN